MASALAHRAKRPFVALSIAVAAFVVLVSLPEFLRLLDARDRFHTVTAEFARRRADNAALRASVRRLNEDPAAIEDVARRELGMFRPGEILFIIKDVPASKP